MSTGSVPLNPSDPNAELKSLRDQVATLNTQLEHLQQYQSLLEQIQAIKLDVQEKWLTFKGARTAGIVALAIMTAVGYGTWKDIKSRVDTQMAQHVERTKVFYDNLMSGSALTVQRNYAAAVPHLLKCFNKGHEYDKAVLLPLLISLNISDDWEDAGPVVAKLRSDPKRFDEINDASIYTIIGAILIQGGISQQNVTATSAVAFNVADGVTMMNRALPLVTPNDLSTRKQIYYNLWLNYIAGGQFDKSQEYIAAINALPSDQLVYSWANMSTWRCVRDLGAKHRDFLAKAEAQWKSLGSRARLGN